MHVRAPLSCYIGRLSDSKSFSELDYARGGGSSGGEVRVCGTRSAATTERGSGEDGEATTGSAEVGTADAHNAVGQMLGIPGTWHGASSEQGISCDSEDGIVIASLPSTSAMTFCSTIGGTVAESAKVPPPISIMRWRRNRLARSAARRRAQIITRKIV